MATFHQFFQESDFSSQQQPVVHIDNLAAMTGVSRFGENPAIFKYSKQEHLESEEFKDMPFDFLLNDHEEVPGYRLVDQVVGYAGLEVSFRPYPWLRLRTKPMVFIFEKLRDPIAPAS